MKLIQRHKGAENKPYVLNFYSPLFSYLLLSILALFLFSCGPARNNETFKTLSTKDQNKYQKYIIQGRDLYKANCASCHQTNGKGVKKLIPPLAGSDYLRENQAKSVDLIKNGASEPVVVNGISYLPTMPAHAHLSNLEIAEILTYINNSWGNEFGFADAKEIKKLLE
ncbi:MAG: cytochrome c [Cyclobacteriaceae bacterium]|nr:cytochrome c [Cyclobacteriaceae bacterium]